MTIVGPALTIGGNIAQMTSKGKIQITNSNGKVKTLSQDEFKNNLIKNADKINNGEDFEFKKSNKNLKILAGAAATTLVASSVIYRKQIGKYVKDFSFKKLWNDVKGLFNNKKALNKKRHATYSVSQARIDAHKQFLEDADIINLTQAERKSLIADAKKAFKK